MTAATTPKPQKPAEPSARPAHANENVDNKIKIDKSNILILGPTGSGKMIIVPILIYFRIEMAENQKWQILIEFRFEEQNCLHYIVVLKYPDQSESINVTAQPEPSIPLQERRYWHRRSHSVLTFRLQCVIVPRWLQQGMWVKILSRLLRNSTMQLMEMLKRPNKVRLIVLESLTCSLH